MRSRVMRRFLKISGTGALIVSLLLSAIWRSLSAHDQINNLFYLRRDHLAAAEHRASRAQTFRVWAEICGVAVAA